MLAYHRIQSSLRQPILLPASEEGFHLYAMVPDLPRSSGTYHLKYLRLANIYSSIPICKNWVFHRPGVFQRLRLLHRVALWTITYRVNLPDPAVGCGSESFNSTSPPPYLAHRKSSTRLLHFIFTTCFPTSHGIHAWRKCCTWVDFPV